MIGWQDHRALAEFMRDKKEHGGNFVVNYGDSALARDTRAHEAKGAFNEVNIDRSHIDWHTHPSQCKSDGTCTVALPSPADLLNVAVGSLYGNAAHVLYTEDGAFVISVPPALQHKLKDTSFQTSFVKRLNTDMYAIHNAFTANQLSYKEYKVKFLNATRRLGFKIKNHGLRSPPYVTLDFPCDRKENREQAVDFLDIPPHMQERFSEKNMNAFVHRIKRKFRGRVLKGKR